MGMLKFEVPNSLPIEDAKKRVEALLGYWNRKYGVASEWAAMGASMKGKAMGVSIDGKLKGKSPITIAESRAGEHLIEASLAGRQSVKRSAPPGRV